MWGSTYVTGNKIEGHPLRNTQFENVSHIAIGFSDENKLYTYVVINNELYRDFVLEPF